MLDHSDSLIALAEVSATFAGFAALVTLFARRRLEGDAAHDLMRLRLVIGASVVSVMAALVPVATDSFGFSPAAMWQISAALFLLLIYFVIGSFLSSYSDVKGSFSPDRLAISIVIGLEVLVQAALIIIVIGMGGERTYGLYLAALIATIGQAAFIFLRLVESSFSSLVHHSDKRTTSH